MRDLVFHVAVAAGVQPEREKPGLLPPRPQDEAIRESSLANGRRPADIWVPRWIEGGPAAWDFAVTSGLQATMLHESARDAAHATALYEKFKQSDRDTADQCRRQGLSFIPLVVEAHGGGWGPAAKKVWKSLARATAARLGQDDSVAAAELAQRISITLQRENARAILRRLPAGVEVAARANASAWVEADAEDMADEPGDADVQMIPPGL